MAINPLNEPTVHEVTLVPHEGSATNGDDTEKVTPSMTNGHA